MNNALSTNGQTVVCVMENIKSRRTVYDFLPDKLSNDAIQTCLEAAIWAPNHRLTQPWRFWVIGPQTQQALAEIYAMHRASKKYDAAIEPKGYQKAHQQAYQRFLAIPQVVMVGQQVSADKKQFEEDYAACACAIQNFQLAAWSMKIGVQWSTGPIITSHETYDILQVAQEEVRFIGALYCGYPQKVCEAKRWPLDKVTVQMP